MVQYFLCVFVRVYVYTCMYVCAYVIMHMCVRIHRGMHTSTNISMVSRGLFENQTTETNCYYLMDSKQHN
jgi:hypothetical protein